MRLVPSFWELRVFLKVPRRHSPPTLPPSLWRLKFQLGIFDQMQIFSSQIGFSRAAATFVHLQHEAEGERGETPGTRKPLKSHQSTRSLWVSLKGGGGSGCSMKNSVLFGQLMAGKGFLSFSLSPVGGGTRKETSFFLNELKEQLLLTQWTISSPPRFLSTTSVLLVGSPDRQTRT